MMFKLSLISLCLLFVGYTSGDPATSSSVTVSNTQSPISNTSPNSKTMTDHQMTLTHKTSPNPQTALHTNPKTTLKTAVASKIATTMNTTTMKNDGTTLNPKDNIRFLFYAMIFAVLCALKLK